MAVLECFYGQECSMYEMLRSLLLAISQARAFLEAINTDEILRLTGCRYERFNLQNALQKEQSECLYLLGCHHIYPGHPC